MKKSWVVASILVSAVLLFFIIWKIITTLFVPNEPLPVINEAPIFTLTTSAGENYHSDNGKVKLLMFMYTKCPAECPMTMASYSQLQNELKEKGWFGEEVELLAISFDENDSLETLADYGANFNQDPSGWHMLGGDPEEVKRVTDSLYYLADRVDEHFFIHSLTIYLIDEQNQIRALHKMAEGFDMEQIMIDLEKAVKEKQKREK